MSSLEAQLRYFSSFIPALKELNVRHDKVRKNLARLKLEVQELIDFAQDELVSDVAMFELRFKAQQYVQFLEKSQKLLREVVQDQCYVLKVLPGVGGDEAELFAKELLSTYTKWLTYKKVTYRLEGTELRMNSEVPLLKLETGTHRVQRMPVTDSKGRVHTSTVVVNVREELKNLDFIIPERDLKFEEMRSSGAGGQHVNKTNSAIRAIHVPTGTFVKIGTSRDKFKNKEMAINILHQKLKDQVNDYVSQLNFTRQSTLAVRERSSKIRTYNFPDNRITDHRFHVSVDLNRTLSSPENWDAFLKKINS